MTKANKGTDENVDGHGETRCFSGNHDVIVFDLEVEVGFDLSSRAVDNRYAIDDDRRDVAGWAFLQRV